MILKIIASASHPEFEIFYSNTNNEILFANNIRIRRIMLHPYHTNNSVIYIRFILVRVIRICEVYQIDTSQTTALFIK